ncbi:MAG TPA: PrsW family glutamic-type intramembrane protease, partial [Candidatus Paceibacterota bacterium]|nr:PrsW family glutamic-type intramembrane protease [Candidatus Paceibacterota bacterium]
DSPEFDEPVDAMIYMMTAGLGFAAIENILVLFRTTPMTGLNGMAPIVSLASIWFLRSLGATLLHALSSSLVGYFLAMAWFFREQRKKLVLLGLVLATMFHFTFNILLSSVQDHLSGLLYSIGLLVIMAFLVFVLFDKIKKRHASNLVPAVTEAAKD